MQAMGCGVFFLICSVSLAAKINRPSQIEDALDTFGVMHPGEVHPMHTPGAHPVHKPHGPPRSHGLMAATFGVSFPCFAGGVVGTLFGNIPGVALGYLWIPDTHPGTIIGGVLGAALGGTIGGFIGHEVTIIDHMHYAGLHDPLAAGDVLDPELPQPKHADHAGHSEAHNHAEHPHQALTAVALSDPARELATGSREKLAEASSQAAGATGS